MGKSKGSQRTKGNVKPSSSGRTAELLGEHSKSGFIGFGSCKVGQHVAHADNNLDSTFTMVMKKMLKKDATTRLKAIQEFRDLCKEKDKEAVLSILAFWPRLYNKLSLDNDRRIREATQEAHAEFVAKVSRDIAPFLKAMMGVWLLAQNDLYPPAASIACSTFVATFPSERQSEALMFCKDDILPYFRDNLFEQTPQTLSEPNTPSEEIQQKYTLVISGTLHGFKLFLTSISDEAKSKLMEDLKAFISHPKFWKLIKIKNFHISVAWYNLVSVLCHNMPEVFCNFESKLGSCILSRLSESDSAVAQAVWEAALNFVAAFENCWDNVDVHKVVLPELWMLLKEGGRGNAAILFPCLLPFLSKLPLDNIGDKQKFFLRFFESLTQGLYLDSGKSTLECNAIVTAYMECLQYVLRHCETEKFETIQKLLYDQVLSLVKSSFTPDGTFLPVSKFYPLFGSFVKSLDSPDLTEQSAIQIADFWKNLETICKDVINGERLPRHVDLVFMAYFFYCLYEPSSCLQKKSKVKFLDTDEKTQIEKKANCFLEQRKNLLRLSTQISVLICQKLDDDPEPHFSKLLLEILSSGLCCELFQGILLVSKSTEFSAKESPYQFFQLIILPWLSKDNCVALLMETVIEIIFITTSCLDQQLADKILNHCCQVDNPKLQQQILRKIMVSRNEDKVFCKKFNNSKLSSTVVKLQKFLLEMLISADKSNSIDDLESYFSTLDIYLKESQSTDFVIDKNYIEEILSIVHTSLKITSDRPNDLTEVDMSIIEFMCDMTDNIFARCDEIWHFPIVDTLMRLFLQLNLVESRNFSESFSQKIISLWKISFNKLAILHRENSEFLFQTAEQFHNLLLQCSGDEKQLVGCIYDFLQIVESVFPSHIKEPSTEHMTSVMFLKILPSSEEWCNLQKGIELNLLCEFLKKTLFYPLPISKVDVSWINETPASDPVAQKVSELIVKFISTKEDSQMNMSMNTIRQQLCHLLQVFSFYDSQGYLKKKDTALYDKGLKLQKNCFKIISFLSEEDAIALIHTLSEMSVENPNEWLLPFKNVVEIICSQHDLDESMLYCLYHLLSDSNNLGNELTCQILIGYLPKVSKLDLVQPLMSRMLSSKNDTLDLNSFARICCCLQLSDVCLSTEVQKYISPLLHKLLSKFSSKHLHPTENVLASSLVHVFITEVIKNCPDEVLKCLPEIMKFSIASFAPLEVSSQADLTIDAKNFLHIHHCCTMICNLLLLLSDECSTTEQSDSTIAFINDVCANLMTTFYNTSASLGSSTALPDVINDFLSTLSAALELLPAKALLDCIVTTDSTIDPSVYLNSILETKFLPLLRSKILPFQLTAHSILFKIMPLVPALLRNESNLEDDIDEDVEGKPIKLVSVTNSLSSLNEVVESMLSDLNLDECCIVVPGTDSYTYTMAFLFAWSQLLELFSACTSQERSDYATHLMQKGLLSSFLSCLFKLLPENPALVWPTEVSAKSSENFKNIFTQPPSLSSLDLPTIADLQHLACNIFYNALKKMPAAVRMWFHRMNKRSSEAVNKFTTKYVSSLLALRELQTVPECNMQFTNMTVLAYPAARELVATYSVENSGIELMIKLPPNYPLGNLNIENQGTVKVNPLKWRHWLTQLRSFLTYQNGSIMDGLQLWKRNLDKTFEGIEECLICLYIVNSSTCELTKKSCPGCKKRFHSSCIHKWFMTSNNTACPMCRHLW